MSTEYYIDTRVESLPEIAIQTNPAFEDYINRIDQYRQQIKTRSYLQPREIFDCDLLTMDEIQMFNFDKKPLWIEMITVDLIRNGDKRGRTYDNVESITFQSSLVADGDAIFIINYDHDYIMTVAHDNISGTFAVYPFTTHQ